MTVGIEDGLIRIVNAQCCRIILTLGVVIGAAVGKEMGGLVDKDSSSGIATSVGGFPEAIAEVDDSELRGN